MFTIPGGLAEQLGFGRFSINLDTVDLPLIPDEKADEIITNPRKAREE